eukprot:11521333-Alexandrium_andersonii.AAC.1
MPRHQVQVAHEAKGPGMRIAARWSSFVDAIGRSLGHVAFTSRYLSYGLSTLSGRLSQHRPLHLLDPCAICRTTRLVVCKNNKQHGHHGMSIFCAMGEARP